MRDLLAGYAATVALFVLACFVIKRSAPDLKGMRSIRITYSVVFVAIVLAMSRPMAPPLVSIVLPHLAVFAALVLIHQSTYDILELEDRHLRFSFALGFAGLVGLLTFTVAYPSVSLRIYCIDTADAIQAGLTMVVLFRSRNAALRFPIRATGTLMAALGVLHLLRIARTVVEPPSFDLLQLGTFQAFFIFFNFVLGLSAGLSLIWLSFCAQRNTLQTLALTDGLTGLLNRRAFEETLRRELTYAHRHGRGTGLVLIDLDFFKDVNDAHGHPVGDEVIRRVSSVFHHFTRGSDALARFGGEEFILMLRDTDRFQASMVAERVREQVESLVDLPADIRITASIGVAISTSSDTPESLFKKADDALYDSKRAGRNTVTCHPSNSDFRDGQAQPELLPSS
jgi:diguanylate cyclase (GGDEF)-like protein